MRDIPGIVAIGGGYIYREAESWQGSQRQVCGPSDTGLEHPTAPDRDTLRPAQVMDEDSLAQPAHPSGFDVYNLAGVHLESRAGMLQAEDAFIQADGCVKLFLKLVMIPEIILIQRLFDQQQFQTIQWT